jgi:hypothetical protein
VAKTTGQSETSGGASTAADEVSLRDPGLAAFLAWLIPGAGHWYQGRRTKAVIYFVCIVGTFVYGLYLGDGRVVYASWKPQDRRLHYLAQIGVGLPAMPALVQAYRVKHGKAPLPMFGVARFMAPPDVANGAPNVPTELDDLHKRLHRYFELGSVYTVVAGLLNVLAIYDAWAGPVRPPPAKKDDEETAPVGVSPGHP